MRANNIGTYLTLSAHHWIKKMTDPKLLVLAFALFPFGASLANSCEATKSIDIDIPAEGLAMVEIRALAGEFDVGPTDDMVVHIRGIACTDETKHLDQMDIKVLQEDGKLRVFTVIPHHLETFNPEHASIDLNVTLPARLPLSIQDTSGDLFIRDVSIVSIEDSSGNIDFVGGLASLSVRDSSGEVKIRKLEGSLTITDSSGDMELDDIAGDVLIPADSSGEIDIRRVTGRVEIDQDGSGDISIDTTGGDVKIGNDGSGDIELEDIAGNAIIERDGSGEIIARRIKGNFEVVSKGDGSIITDAISGELRLPSD